MMGERKKHRGCIMIGVLIVLGVAAFAVMRNYGKQLGIGPVANSKKYGDALKVAMQFFDIQKSGKLVNNKISWRGDSGLEDGKEANLDLSKGMYDAGDHMKFGFPMAFTATVLSWAILEYGDNMELVDQLQSAKDSLKWITDYLVNAHPKHDVLYIQVLLSRVSFFGPEDASDMENIGEYRKTAEAIMCSLLPNSPSASSSRTKGGLIWVSKWHALQQPVAFAFLAVLFSDYMLSSDSSKLECNSESFSPSDLREFAISQVDYVLGENPMKMSYLVGCGDKYPQYVHHRGASIPVDATGGCKNGWKWLKSNEPNPNVATGALVGGPSENDKYVDLRNNSMQGEPSTYNSAVLVGLLSGLVSVTSVPKFFK